LVRIYPILFDSGCRKSNRSRHETLGYVFDAIKLTKEMLNDEVPLIGFAGSPWTIMCYAVEGQGSKSFDARILFLSPRSSTCFIAKITDTTILYLKKKSKIGSRCRSNF
jgi:uroporphyrinogen decarboxylase